MFSAVVKIGKYSSMRTKLQIIPVLKALFTNLIGFFYSYFY